jgi:predicted metal-dependent peptidase
MMDKIGKALIYLLQGNGTFYAEFFLHARRVESKTVLPPGALLAVGVTNGRIMLYTDESRLTNLTIEQVARGLEHEALHILNGHSKRMGSKDPNGWNIATDLSINSIIQGMDIGLIPGKDQFKDFIPNLSAEIYYEQLPKEMKGEGGGDNGEGNTPSPNCSGSRQELDDFDKEVIKQAVGEAKKTADTMGKGNLPSDVEKLINEFLKKPTISWKTLLKQFIASTVKANSKTTWRRENRRKVPLKGRLKDRMLRLALALDTSGSIFGDPQLLGEFYSEISGIQQAYNSEILVIECDATVQKTYTLRPGQRPNPSPRGGGVTSFRPVYEWLKDNHKKPDVLVYLTDLYGDFPDKEYIRTVWCVCEGGAKEIPFGRMVRITKGGK